MYGKYGIRIVFCAKLSKRTQKVNVEKDNNLKVTQHGGKSIFHEKKMFLNTMHEGQQQILIIQNKLCHPSAVSFLIASP